MNDEDIADIRVNIACIQKDIEFIKDSLGVLNHNSTTMSERISALETAHKTTSDYKDFVKKLASTLGGMAVFVATLLAILRYLTIL